MLRYIKSLKYYNMDYESCLSKLENKSEILLQMLCIIYIYIYTNKKRVDGAECSCLEIKCCCECCFLECIVFLTLVFGQPIKLLLFRAVIIHHCCPFLNFFFCMKHLDEACAFSAKWKCYMDTPDVLPGTCQRFLLEEKAMLTRILCDLK